TASRAGGAFRPPARCKRLAAEELQQRLVELVRVRTVEAVRPALDEHELALGDGLVRALAARLEGDDRVGIAVDDQGWHRHLLQIAAEVGAAERVDAIQRSLRRRERPDFARVDSLLLAHLQLAARAEEQPRELVDEG